MLRFLAGAAACFLLMTGAFLIWQSRADEHPGLPSARRPARTALRCLALNSRSRRPRPAPQSRAEKRFSRYDKNKDGKVQADEYLAARRKNFDKVDMDHNGALSFQEYAVKGIEKFQAADHRRKGWLTEAELATTAPPPAKHKSCSCGRTYASRATPDDEASDN